MICDVKLFGNFFFNHLVTIHKKTSLPMWTMKSISLFSSVLPGVFQFFSLACKRIWNKFVFVLYNGVNSSFTQYFAVASSFLKPGCCDSSIRVNVWLLVNLVLWGVDILPLGCYSQTDQVRGINRCQKLRTTSDYHFVRTTHVRRDI